MRFLVLILFSCVSLHVGGIALAAESGKKQSKPRANMEEYDGLGMNIIGGKDLPQVLYIVPWKAPGVLAEEKPESRIMQAVFSPIDPEVFERSVRFHERLRKAKGTSTKQND